MIRLFVCALVVLSSVIQCAANATPTLKRPSQVPVSPSPKSQANKASKLLLAKLKSQALAQARQELAKENENKERARLEALEELNNETVEESSSVDNAE